MKTRINNVKKGVVTLLFAAVIAGLTACETDPVKSQRGELPDKDLLENTYVKIRSIKSPTEFAVVNLSEGTTVTEDRIYCRLTRPAERAMTITAAVDESLVEACNEEYGTDLLPFPAGNVTIAGNGTIAVAAGERLVVTLSDGELESVSPTKFRYRSSRTDWLPERTYYRLRSHRMMRLLRTEARRSITA